MKKKDNIFGELIFGRRPVEELLKIKPKDQDIQEIFTSTNLPSSLEASIKQHLPNTILHKVSRKQIDNLFPKINHQGIVIKSRPGFSFIHYKQLSSWQEHVQKTRGLLILLDSIQDSVNLGSIIRSAETLGAKALFITGKGASLDENVHRISAGASLHLPIFSVANLHQLVQSLKKMNFWICSSSGEISKKKDITGDQIWLEHSDLEKIPSSQDLALIIGHEGEGIRPLVLKESDFIISIRLQGRTKSLNAAVAAAILMDRLVSRK